MAAALSPRGAPGALPPPTHDAPSARSTSLGLAPRPPRPRGETKREGGRPGPRRRAAGTRSSAWSQPMGSSTSSGAAHEDCLRCQGGAARRPVSLPGPHLLAPPELISAPHALVPAHPRSAGRTAGLAEALPSSSRSGEDSEDADLSRVRVARPTAAASAQDTAVDRGPMATTTADGSAAPLIILPGGGMFFYWQLGALGALARCFDVSRFHYEGASAGALAGALAVCSVDGPRAAEAAFQLTLDNRVWDRPAGLAGVWGRLVREWLDDLLPADAAELCSSRLGLQVLELPSFRRRDLQFRHTLVTSFHSKQDVLDCCMASVHIPFFMDGRLCTRFRGRRCIDGSFMAPPYQAAIDRRPDHPALILDYTFDEEMKRRRWAFLSLGDKEGGHASTWDWITEMMVRGAEYVDALVDSGKLDSFKPHSKTS